MRDLIRSTLISIQNSVNGFFTVAYDDETVEKEIPRYRIIRKQEEIGNVSPVCVCSINLFQCLTFCSRYLFHSVTSNSIQFSTFVHSALPSLIPLISQISKLNQ